MTDPFARVLIVGARGQLGAELMRAFAESEPLAPTRAELDLTRRDALGPALERLQPTLVINTAAFHHVDTCEADPESAFAVNAVGVAALAEASARVGAAFAHVSTDYVFDGRKGAPYDETDAPGPLNAYGASKLAGERLVAESGERWFVIRTSGLYGRTGRSSKGPAFVERMVRGAESGEALRVVDDVVFSPSYAPHVAAAMRAILATEHYGLYHVTDAGSCSWHEFACAALRLRGLKWDVEAVKSETRPGAAKRPANSSLAHGALARGAFPPMPRWEEGLREYLASRAAREDGPASASM